MIPVCRLDGVKKTYGQTPVLDGVSLQVDGGEWVAITGASGSGKSSLLQLLGGLDRAYEGSAMLDGRELRALSDLSLIHI